MELAAREAILPVGWKERRPYQAGSEEAYLRGRVIGRSHDGSCSPLVPTTARRSPRSGASRVLRSSDRPTMLEPSVSSHPTNETGRPQPWKPEPKWRSKREAWRHCNGEKRTIRWRPDQGGQSRASKILGDRTRVAVLSRREDTRRLQPSGQPCQSVEAARHSPPDGLGVVESAAARRKCQVSQCPAINTSAACSKGAIRAASDGSRGRTFLVGLEGRTSRRA